jgi:hypothetical protein
MSFISADRRAVAVAAAFVVGAVAATPAHGQTSRAFEPGPLPVIAEVPLPPVPPGSPLSEPTAEAGPATWTAARTLALRPFQAHARRDGWVELVHERDTVIATFDIPNRPAVAAASLDLRLRNAADVLPDASAVTVLLNGEPLGRVRLDAVSRAKAVTFSIDPERLRGEANTLRLIADHAHRVSCTEAGTFELWSQIDPDASGVSLTYADRVPVPEPADLATWLRAGAFHGDTVPVLQTAGPASSHQALRALQVAQGLAARAGRRMPAFAPGVLPASTTGLAGTTRANGLAVVVGDVASVSEAIGPGLAGRVDGPYIGLHPLDGPDGAYTLVISGRTSAEVDTAVAAFADWRPAPTAPAVSVDGPRSLSFGEMGLAGQPFGGTLYDREVAFRLPVDAFPRQQQEAAFDLVYRHAGPIGADAAMVIWVNGVVAATRRLDATDSGRDVDARFTVPLTRFRPGDNRVRIVVRLPYPDGVGCPDWRARQAAAPRFTLAERSTLSLPAMSRLLATPELQTTAAHGHPYARSPEPLTVVLPGFRPAGLAAAMAVTAQLSRAADAPLDLRAAAQPPSAAGANGVIVTTVDTLDPAVLAAAGVDRQALARVLRGEARELDGLRARTTVDQWLGDRFRRLRRGFTPARAPAEPVAAVMQTTGHAGADEVWTVVVAASVEQLRTAAGVIRRPETWGDLAGALALVGADGRVVTALAPHAQHLHAPGKTDVAAAALIAGAWLSDRVTWMIGGVLALCLLGGGLLHGAVRRTGRGHDLDR